MREDHEDFTHGVRIMIGIAFVVVVVVAGSAIAALLCGLLYFLNKVVG